MYFLQLFIWIIVADIVFGCVDVPSDDVSTLNLTWLSVLFFASHIPVFLFEIAILYDFGLTTHHSLQGVSADGSF